MTKEELNDKKMQFEKSLDFMLYASRERTFDSKDFKNLNWIVRNLDRLRNYSPEELVWDDENKEVIVKK